MLAQEIASDASTYFTHLVPSSCFSLVNDVATNETQPLSLAYVEMRIILARLIYNFDLRLAEDSHRWIERQRSYALWARIPLNCYLTRVSPSPREQPLATVSE